MDLRELDLGEGNAGDRFSLPELLTLHPVSPISRTIEGESADPSNTPGPEARVFEGASTTNTGSRVFGGLVLGQVVAAAALTLPDGYAVHHLSGQFAAPADGRAPLRFHVKHVRDGRAFAVRTVEAVQHDRVVFAGLVSGYRGGYAGGTGIDHQVPRLEGPGPKESPNGDAWYAPWPDHVRYTRRLELELGLELRFPSPPVHVAALRGEPTEPRQSVWVRSAVPLPDLPDGNPDPVLHAAAFAYVSDLLLLGASLGPHQRTMFDADVQVATINHALWLHGPVRVDDWVRVDQFAPWSGNGVAMCRSELFAPDGRLVGSVGQESLIRILP